MLENTLQSRHLWRNSEAFGQNKSPFQLDETASCFSERAFCLAKIGRLNNPGLLFVHLQAVFVKGKEDVSSRKDFFLFLHGEKDYQRGLEREYVAV